MEGVCQTILTIQSLYIPISFSESEEDVSSEEEECNILLLSKKRKLATPQRIENYVETTIPRFTAKQFQQHFRITIDAYESLLTLIGPQLARQTPVGRSRINAEKQVLAVVWLLATPDSYR